MANPYLRPADHSGPIRVGLIGFGVAGRVFHAPLLAADPAFSVDVIVTADQTRSSDAHGRHPGARVVSHPDDLFALAEELDLAVIASPTPTHVALAHAALDAGLAVVVDKPFAVTTAEGRALVDAADRAGLLLQVFQNRRWDGDFLTVRDLISAGTLGTIHRFESRFERWKPVIRPSWKDTTEQSAGAGLTYDLGSHLVDQALELFGPVTDVHADLGALRAGAHNDDDSFICLHHQSGTRSQLWMSYLAAAAGPRFRLLGDSGAFVKYGLDPQEDALAAGADPSREGFGVEPEERWGSLTKDGATTTVPTRPGAYADFYRDVAVSLIKGVPGPVDSTGPLAALEIIERIVSAAGSPVA